MHGVPWKETAQLMHLRTKLLIVVTNLSVEFQAAQVLRRLVQVQRLLQEEMIHGMLGAQSQKTSENSLSYTILKSF